jgi:hypothetical protein
MTPLDRLRAVLSGLPGVAMGTTRFGARQQPAWFVDGREFAHLHADDRLDLRLPRSAQTALRGDPRAHFRKSRSEWLEFEFHTPADVTDLAPLVREASVAAKRR